jgi:hypothetical protein
VSAGRHVREQLNVMAQAALHTVDTEEQSKQRTEIPPGCMAKISLDKGTL